MRDSGLIVILRGAPQYPANVRPPTAVARRMRIAGAICVRMMYAMRYDPLNRTAFERERAADRQKIFNCFRNFITAMGK